MAYIFTSSRLGFRNWNANDLPVFSALNADAEVMEHFPKALTETESTGFMERLQVQYDKRGYTYFATEIIATGELIGFIGLAYQEYETEFTPAVDIGWRLKKTAWGNGYATEGAKRCLAFAFDTLQLNQVISTCTKMNARSENVMQKIGMKQMGEFKHPRLADFPEIEMCVWYALEKN
ncbi:MAG: GNAT family N-acetyltransferase [Bacteroidia bacterium]